MKDNKPTPFEIDFDSYILQSEPDKRENGRLWQTAIGLQQVDGLTPSKYLYETARRNIDGEITIEQAKKLIDSYYETRQGKAEDDGDVEEADKVSVRIREILAEKTFSFTPDLLLSIHKLEKGIPVLLPCLQSSILIRSALKLIMNRLKKTAGISVML